MKIWFDTEFFERPGSIDLISIGLVSEDGRELYRENADFDWTKVPADHWIQTNVRPHLAVSKNDVRYLKAPAGIARDILTFIGDEKPRFWGYFADYDWVLFCWLFGSMIDLPPSFPQFCRDLKQWAVLHGSPKLLPHTGTAHNALDDARWTRDAWIELATTVGIEHP